MTITAQTSTTLDDYVVSFFKWETIEALRGKLGLAKKCQMWGSDQFAEKGATIQVPVAPVYTVQERTSANQTNAYTFATANSSNFTMTLDSEFYIALADTTFLSTFSNPSRIKACINAQITAMAQKFEETICGVVSQFTASGSNASAIGSYTTPVTTWQLGLANKYLTDQKYLDDQRVCVLSTSDYLSLSNDPALKQLMVLGGGSVKPYKLDLWESQYVTAASDPATGTRNFAFYGPEIVVATAVPYVPDNVKSITIRDTDSGLTIQYYEGFDVTEGKVVTVVRCYFAVKPQRATAGVELKGTTTIAGS